MDVPEWDIFTRLERLEEKFSDLRVRIPGGEASRRGTTDFDASGSMSVLACQWSLSSLMLQCRNQRTALAVLESSINTLKKLPFEKDIVDTIESSLREIYKSAWED